VWQKAYEAQCITHDQKTPERQTHPRAKLTLFALAFGSFCGAHVMLGAFVTGDGYAPMDPNGYGIECIAVCRKP
jgi:hypothetical protein